MDRYFVKYCDTKTLKNKIIREKYLDKKKIKRESNIRRKQKKLPKSSKCSTKNNTKNNRIISI